MDRENSPASAAPAKDRMLARFISVLHFAVILASLLLLYAVTYDALCDVSFLTDRSYLHLQFWVCIFFIFEAVFEWAVSPGRLRNLASLLFVIVLCIPYTSLIHHYHWQVSLEIYYLLRIMPLVRAVTVLVIMWGIMQKNWVTGLFGSYIVIMLVTLYVLSLMFYVEEHHVNPAVTSYWESLWYSVMQLNTCGSNISPVTSAGKVIGVVLSIEGLILFPVFTVFITKAFGSNQNQEPETSQ